MTYTTLGSSVDSTGSSFLETKLGQDLVETRMFGEILQFAVDAGANTSS